MYKNPIESVDLIRTLISAAEEDLLCGDEPKRDFLIRSARVRIKKIFGRDSEYLDDLGKIHFYPRFAATSSEFNLIRIRHWEDAKREFINLCQSMIEDIQLGDSAHHPESKNVSSQSDKVFIVHGHDNEMKEAVARTVTSIALKPIILHEQPDRNKTVIEKFVGHSDVGFAVVLLSPDDMGYERTEKPKTARPRARQNVILELGFFLGKLGRERVLTLYREESGFEMPSDYAGVLFKPFDARGHWRFELVKELKACGYEVSADAFC